MAEIGLVGMALGVLDMSRSMYSSASSTKNTDQSIRDLLDELQVLDAVFAESMVMAKDLSTRTPASIVAALERCRTRKEALAKVMKRVLGDAGNTRVNKERMRTVKNHVRYTLMSDEVAANRNHYRSAVLLLQNVVTNTVTHDLLRNMQTTTVVSGVNATDRSTDVLFALTGQRTYHENGDTINEALEKLEPILPQPMNDSSIPEVNRNIKPAREIMCPACKSPWCNENAVPDTYEVLTLFNATICCVGQVNSSTGGGPSSAAHQGAGLWYPVRGKYDTGADGDFVARDVLERAQLTPFITTLKHPVFVKALGQEHKFESKIRLTWVLNYETQSEQRDFYVAPEADFDILLGNPYLQQHKYMKILQNNSMFTKLSFRNLIVNMWRSREARKREQENKVMRDEQARLEAEQESANQALARDDLRRASAVSTTVTSPVTAAGTPALSRGSSVSNVHSHLPSTVSTSALPQTDPTSGGVVV